MRDSRVEWDDSFEMRAQRIKGKTSHFARLVWMADRDHRIVQQSRRYRRYPGTREQLEALQRKVKEAGDVFWDYHRLAVANGYSQKAKNYLEFIDPEVVVHFPMPRSHEDADAII